MSVESGVEWAAGVSRGGAGVEQGAAEESKHEQHTLTETNSTQKDDAHTHHTTLTTHYSCIFEL